MSLIDENPHFPLVAARQRIQRRARVEVVVVVAHDHIRPAHELLSEIVRANSVRAGYLTQRRLVEHSAFDGFGASGGQPVIKSTCQWTGVSGAFLVGVLASLLARYELEDA